jgi:hypothetical protein
LKTDDPALLPADDDDSDPSADALEPARLRCLAALPALVLVKVEADDDEPPCDDDDTSPAMELRRVTISRNVGRIDGSMCQQLRMSSSYSGVT